MLSGASHYCHSSNYWMIKMYFSHTFYWRMKFRSEILVSLFSASVITLPVFDVFLTVHHSIDFFSNYQLNAHFLHSIKVYMLHYNPQHVSSSTLPIFRRTNCIITASGIVTLGRPVCRLRADCSPLSICILYGCLQRVTIPEAVVIQFVLLRMSRVLLETCRGS